MSPCVMLGACEWMHPRSFSFAKPKDSVDRFLYSEAVKREASLGVLQEGKRRRATLSSWRTLGLPSSIKPCFTTLDGESAPWISWSQAEGRLYRKLQGFQLQNLIVFTARRTAPTSHTHTTTSRRTTIDEDLIGIPRALDDDEDLMEVDGWQHVVDPNVMQEVFGFTFPMSTERSAEAQEEMFDLAEEVVRDDV